MGVPCRCTCSLWSLTRVAPNRSESLNLNQTCTAGETKTCSCCCYHPDMLAVISGVADIVLHLLPLTPTAAARMLTRATRRSLAMMRTGAGACGRLSGASPERDMVSETCSGAPLQAGEPWAGLGPPVKLSPWRPRRPGWDGGLLAKPLFVRTASHAREAFRVDSLDIYPGPGSKDSVVDVDPEPWATPWATPPTLSRNSLILASTCLYLLS